MLKALIKKQFAELLSLYLKDKKTGKIKVGKSAVGICILYIFIYIAVAGSFASIGWLFADILCGTEYSWLYFSLEASFAFLVTVLLNSLTTYTMLYISRDNEFLLSLPIPPSKILFSRMLVVYIEGLIFQSMIMLPASVIYFVLSKTTIKEIICVLISNLALSFLIMCFVCLFGYFISKIAFYLKNKNILTVLISVCAIGGIYYFQFRLNSIITKLAENYIQIGEFISHKLIIAKWLGVAFTQNIIYALLFLLISCSLLALIYYISGKNFIKTVTAVKGDKKKVRKELSFKRTSPEKALLKKELSRFLSSPAYMLNAGIGLLFMIIGSILLILFKQNIGSFIKDIPYNPMLEFVNIRHIIPIVILFMLSMNTISAPSISLEGKTMWLLRSLPVAWNKMIRAKVKFHIYINIFPAVLISVSMGYAFDLTVMEVIALIILCACFILFHSLTGILSNLKKPMLEWTNETVPIKQSFSVAVAIFGGFGMSLLVMGIISICDSFIPYSVTLNISVIPLLIVSSIKINKLKSKGQNLIEEL